MKYVTLLLAALLFAGCVTDELPEVEKPADKAMTWDNSNWDEAEWQ